MRRYTSKTLSTGVVRKTLVDKDFTFVEFNKISKDFPLTEVYDMVHSQLEKTSSNLYDGEKNDLIRLLNLIGYLNAKIKTVYSDVYGKGKELTLDKIVEIINDLNNISKKHLYWKAFPNEDKLKELEKKYEYIDIAPIPCEVLEKLTQKFGKKPYWEIGSINSLLKVALSYEDSKWKNNSAMTPNHYIRKMEKALYDFYDSVLTEEALKKEQIIYIPRALFKDVSYDLRESLDYKGYKVKFKDQDKENVKVVCTKIKENPKNVSQYVTQITYSDKNTGTGKRIDTIDAIYGFFDNVTHLKEQVTSIEEYYYSVACKYVKTLKVVSDSLIPIKEYKKHYIDDVLRCIVQCSCFSEAIRANVGELIKKVYGENWQQVKKESWESLFDSNQVVEKVSVDNLDYRICEFEYFLNVIYDKFKTANPLALMHEIARLISEKIAQTFEFKNGFLSRPGKFINCRKFFDKTSDVNLKKDDLPF